MPEPQSGLDVSFAAHGSGSEQGFRQPHIPHDLRMRNVARQNAGALPRPRAANTESTAPRDHTVDSPFEVDLPSFIKPLPPTIDPEDLQFLIRKGALTVPEVDLRAEIFKSYLFTVYPFMPILSLESLVDPAQMPEGGRKMSLLLFQAVMFAGLSSLNKDLVQQTGYMTLKQARKGFFNKVLLLYNFNAEPDDTAVVQTLLLMSLWYEKWNDRKHTWHWTGLAISLAQSMGLHRRSGAAKITMQEQRLRRRIWWSLYIRDRLIALGTRRPMRIKDDEHDLPLLTIEDFDIGSFDSYLAEHFCELPASRNAGESRYLALMCIELIKLCICIGHVLSSQYNTLGERSPLTSTLMVVPRSPAERAKGLANLDNELQQWSRSFDPQVRIGVRDSAVDTSKDSLAIHWAILQMIYHTSLSILHRPQILQPSLSDSDGGQTQRLSRERVKNSARMITKIMHTMLRRDQVRFLPTSGVPALLSASLGHMLDITSQDEDTRDASIFRFYQTMQVLQRLREIYASADAAVWFLASAVRKAGISGPIQLDQQAAPAFMIATTDNSESQSTLPFSAPLSDIALTQLPKSNHTGMNSQETQSSSHQSIYSNSLSTASEGHLSSTLRDGHQGFCTSNGTTFGQTGSNPPHIGTTSTRLDARDSACLSSETSSHIPFNTGLNEISKEQLQDMSTEALPDPLSYWVVSEDLPSLTSSLDHFLSEDPSPFSYEICSDAFGLLDSWMGDKTGA